MPSPQPINLKTKANRVVVIHVFPRFKQLLVFSLSPHWLLEIFSVVLIGRFNYFVFSLHQAL